MKADLDRLMEARHLAGLIVYVSHDYSPIVDYLVGGVRITGGFIVKKVGCAPILVVNPMETEEAAATGYQVYSYNDFEWARLLKEAGGNRTKAEVSLWGRALQKAEISEGKIGIYGSGELNFILEFVKLMEKAYPQYEFIGELGRTLFAEAAITKDTDELERIKSVAERTSAVLQATWDYIGGHQANDGTVIRPDGSPLTIGDVKRFIRRELMDRDLEDTGMIFAQGRDGGFPHSRGQETMALKLGQAIVFDLFPRELGGGYHHDCTRTWCIGYAPEEVQAVYDTVMNAFDISIEAYGLNKPTHLMQEAVLDYFEASGHPTSRSDEGTTNGYIHSLGHGLGLEIHERPRITHLSEEDRFQAGNFITIEPGLYYPDKGFGVRVEDAFYIADDGELIPLTNFHKELVLPLAEL